MKVLKHHERFWKKIFDYIIQNRIVDPYGFLFEVVVVPSVINPSLGLAKELQRWERKFQFDGEKTAVAVSVVVNAFSYYHDTKRFPRTMDRILELLYEAIMKDLRESEGEIDWEEFEKAEDNNLASLEIGIISKVFIESALKNENVDIVNRKLKELLEREKESIKTKEAFTTLIEEHFILDIFDEKIEEYYPGVWKALEANKDKAEEDMIKALHGKIEGDSIILPRILLRYIFSLITFVQKENFYIKELEEYIEILKKQQEEQIKQWRGVWRFLIEEQNKLVEEIQALRSVERKIEEKKEEVNIDKLLLEIETLKAENARLSERINDLEEMLEEARKQMQQEIEIELKPLEKSVDIAYFGIENPALSSFLARLNIHLRFFSPVEKPRVVPDFPIVFNIDVASHEVWNVIREKKPLLVSGSNAEILGKRIYEWILKSI